jgi:hypothetical protein
MDMMQCPHCRAQNSVKRESCYQCNGQLRGAPKTPAPEGAHTCATCSRAAIYAPPGHRLSTDQVWCTVKSQALASAKVADECFAEAFVWSRSEILG